ncbi:MAG TPA: hypothetical protein VHN12_15885 [Geobacteraceae bacterium]|nr:hypothetical protein [Geobacteraceae bacterium]
MAVDIGAMTVDIGFCTGAGTAGFAASSFLLQAAKARVREKHNANEISFFICMFTSLFCLPVEHKAHGLCGHNNCRINYMIILLNCQRLAKSSGITFPPLLEASCHRQFS